MTEMYKKSDYKDIYVSAELLMKFLNKTKEEWDILRRESTGDGMPEYCSGGAEATENAIHKIRHLIKEGHIMTPEFHNGNC